MLTRRASLLLALLFAGCGGGGGGGVRRSYPPLRYDYLAPLRLNVATIRIEQRFVPSGAAPDVSQYDPVPPLRALRAMAEDRLQALGSTGEAVLIIQDASLVRRKDTLFGNLSVELRIHAAPDERTGYAQASVSGTVTGDLDDLSGRLYDMTKDLMDRMNVEFEYQIRRALQPWLLPDGATQAPVEQQPLTQTPLPMSP